MVVMGEVVGHAPRDIAASVEGTIQTEGVVEVPKATTSGSAITQGQRLYWDASNLIAVTTKSTHKCLGFAQEAAAASASVVRVQLARWYDS
jgi:predicted RecA/RadA family phage recombinase